MNAAQALNESMPGYIVDKLQKAMNGSLEGKKVAVLGLAFKAGTSDVRKSPGVLLANILNKSGAIVTTYDPQANNEASDDLRKGINQCNSIEDAIKGVDALIIATEWSEFLEYSPTKYAKATKNNKIFVDSVNRFDISSIEKVGFSYIGVGR